MGQGGPSGSCRRPRNTGHTALQGLVPCRSLHRLTIKSGFVRRSTSSISSAAICNCAARGASTKLFAPGTMTRAPSLQVNPDRQSFSAGFTRHRRRYFQLHHEDGEYRLSRNAGHAGRSWESRFRREKRFSWRRRSERDFGIRAARLSPGITPTTNARSIKQPRGQKSNSKSASSNRPRVNRPGHFISTAAGSARKASIAFIWDSRRIAWDRLIKQAVAERIFVPPGTRANWAVDSPRRRRRALRSVSRPGDFFDSRRAKPGRWRSEAALLPENAEANPAKSHQLAGDAAVFPKAACSTDSTWPAMQSPKAARPS